MERGPRAWENASSDGRPGGTTDALHQAGTCRLLIHSVADDTWLAYAPCLKAFLYDARLNSTKLDTVDQLDWAATRYMDSMCYRENRNFSVGAKLLAGLHILVPEAKGHLPRAAHALMAWSRLYNPEEGGPVPEAALAFLVRDFAHRGLWPHVVVTLLSYDTFAREADWESVIANDVAVHQRGGSGQLVVAMVLGAGARGLSAKTGADQGVVVEDALVASIVADMVAVAEPMAKLIPIAQTEFRREWWTSLANIGVKARWPPHRSLWEH